MTFFKNSNFIAIYQDILEKILLANTCKFWKISCFNATVVIAVTNTAVFAFGKF